MKTLLSILLILTGFSVLAQNPISTPRIRMPDRSGVDTTTISNIGQIVFDADDDKFRFNDGTGWFSFLKEGATLPYWPLTGTKALTGNTSINGAFNLNLGTSGSKLNNFFVWTESATVQSSGSGETAKLVIDHDAAVTHDLSFTAPSSDNYIRLNDNNSIEMQVSDSFSFLNHIQLTPTQFSVQLFSFPSFIPTVGFTMEPTQTVIATGSDDDNNINLYAESAQERLRIVAEATASPGSELQINLANPDVVELRSIADTLALTGADLIMVKDGDGTTVFEASVENGRPTITVGDINMVGDLIIDEGTNRIMGTATLSSGTVTVNTTKVTANSRIFLTINGGTLTNVGTPYVSARNAGTSFTITSTNSSDASDVAWIIIEPTP